MARFFNKKELRILVNSILASVVVGMFAVTGFEEMLKLDVPDVTAACLSTALVSLIAVPVLRISFESNVSMTKAFFKYFLVCSLYILIMKEAYPLAEHFAQIDFYIFNPYTPFFIVKVIFYPFYYLSAKYFIFK